MYIPNLENPSTIITGPDTQDIFPISHTQDGSTDLLACFCELVTNHSKDQLLPVPIRNSLLQSHNPLSALSILIVFPDRTDTLLEYMIVRNER